MPAIAGRLSTIELSEDGNTFVSLGGIVDITYNINIDEIETTAHDSNGARSYLPNFDDQTLDVSCRWIEGDVAQKLIIDAAKNKTLFYYRFKMQATSRTFVGRAFPTSMSLSGALDDVAGADFTLRCTVLDDPAPALDLAFAETLSLTDQATGANLITFTRATAATYVGSDGLIKTAASGQPRFDHDPTTRRSLGLLIEEQRTNLVSQSERLDLWGRDGAQISISTGHIAPDGSTNAWLLDKYTSATSIGIALFVPLSNSGTYVHSWFLKAGTAAETIVSIYDSTTGISKWAVYSWAGGVPSVSSVTSETEAFDPVYYGNGWWRVSVKVLNLNSANPNSSYLYPTGFGSATGTVYAWGAQIEESSFPTSYIPTAGAAATRNVDSVLIDGANFSSWYNQNEGSFFAEYQRPFDANAVGYVNPRIFSVSQGTSLNDRIEIFSGNGTGRDDETVYVVTGGSVTADIRHPPTIGANESARMSMSYSAILSQASSSRDGNPSVGDTSAAIFTSMDRIRVGNVSNAPSAGNSIHNGTIKRLTYYSTRLNNAILQGLTSR